jgi:hypothetical protein
MPRLNIDLRTDAIGELFGALYMLANALYFQHFVRLCVKVFGAKPLSPKTIVLMRVLAACLAIILGFMSLKDMSKAS